MNAMWLIGAAILLVIVAAAIYVAQKQRSRQLRKNFGPEYEHAVDGFGERRAAERALIDRTRRVDKLQIRPLAAARRDELWNHWQAVQAKFVDDPAIAVQEAHTLLSNVMREQGYPTGKFDEEVELLSVHHPATVQHYRAAHQLADARAQGRNATEDLRQTMIHYRALVEDLLNLGITHNNIPESHRQEARHEV